MARGDITLFDEGKAYLMDGGWEPADDIKLAILDNTVAPLAADATPALADYTEVGVAGNYVAGGVSLGTYGSMITEAAGVVTFDSAVNPAWAADALNDVDAYWGLIYNDTDVSNLAIGFVDLGGPVDMSAGPLTINWPALGIFTF